MIPLDLSEVAALCPGLLTARPGAETVTGVRVDSRLIEPGDLFMAVGGGASYAAEARDRGAAATLVPDDAEAALAALARSVRARSTARVAGITGSTGKTSTKDILAAMCAPRVPTIAAEASFNNELGVPLTLCRLEADTEICILELAMRGLGQIAALAELARPHIGVVTNVGPAHLERVGSLEAVARAKGELIEALPAGGTAIVPEAFPVQRDDLEIVRIGEPDVELREGSAVIHFDGREVEIGVRSPHQARNALAALCAARALGIEVEGRVDVAFSRWRGEEMPLPGGGILINDCWNANPVSMRAALEDLAARAAGRRAVAVLGEMAELGIDAEAYHREIGALVEQLGVAVLVAVGPLARSYLEAAPGVQEGSWTVDAAEAKAVIQRLVEPGDVVLVKASRAVGLEVVAEALSAVAI